MLTLTVISKDSGCLAFIVNCDHNSRGNTVSFNNYKTSKKVPDEVLRITSWTYNQFCESSKDLKDKTNCMLILTN